MFNRRILGIRKRWLVGLVIASVIVLVAGTLFIINQPKQSPITLFPVQRPVAEQNNYYCSFSARAFVCQDIAKGAARKYNLPEKFGDARIVLANPTNGNLLLQTAGDPSNINDTGHVYIVDRSFAVSQELPRNAGHEYVGLAWASDHVVAAAVRSVQSGRTALSLYDTNTKKLTASGFSTDKAVKVVAGENGGFVAIEERTVDYPTLRVLDLDSKKIAAIDTTALKQTIQSYGTLGYDSASNHFYISGSRDGKPVLAIASVTGDKRLALSVQKTVSDGGAYVPLQPVAGGLLASKQLAGKTSYGVFGVTGIFSARPLSPSVGTAFAMQALPDLAAAPSSSVEAADFVAVPPSAPQTLRNVATELVDQSNCPAGQFDQVTLLGHDDAQAAMQVNLCGLDSRIIKYYKIENGAYVYLGQSLTTPPECQLKESLGLNDTVAPSCKPDDDGRQLLPPVAPTN